MKTLLFCLAIIFLYNTASAQPVQKAILTKNKLGYSKGDTILLTGYFPYNSAHPNKYVAKSATGNTRLISFEYVQLIDTIQDFWDKGWFFHRSGKIAKNGNYVKLRKRLNNEYNAYYTELRNNNLLYDNPETQQYLDNLLLKIGPHQLYKGIDAKPVIHIVKAEQPDIFSFDNGAIFVTTGWLAGMSSEEEISTKLAEELGHVVFDHQYQNRKSRNIVTGIVIGAIVVTTVALIASSANNDDHHHNNRRHYHSSPQFAFFIEGFISASNDHYMPPPVQYGKPASLSNYSKAQNAEALNFANNFKVEKYYAIDQPTSVEFYRNISGAITYTAWNRYFNNDYKGALAFEDKLENNNAMSVDDYLLKAKIYRKIYATEEAQYEALKYIQMAKDMGSSTNIELLKEEALIYYQLKDMSKARESLEEYKYALESVGINSENDRRELSWTNQMIQKTM